MSKLIPASMNIPSLGESGEDSLAVVKLFFPVGSAAWWISEYDRENDTAYGYVCLDDPGSAEYGYISISELEDMTVMGMKVQRDHDFIPTLLSDIEKEIQVAA